MSHVYEARRESIAGVSPRVALKLIDPERAHEKAFRQLFINEAQVSSNLRHQNLVQIQDFDEAGFFLLVMECRRITLGQLITRRRHGLLYRYLSDAEVGRQSGWFESCSQGLYAGWTSFGFGASRREAE